MAAMMCLIINFINILFNMSEAISWPPPLISQLFFEPGILKAAAFLCSLAVFWVDFFFCILNIYPKANHKLVLRFIFTKFLPI